MAIGMLTDGKDLDLVFEVPPAGTPESFRATFIPYFPVKLTATSRGNISGRYARRDKGSDIGFDTGFTAKVGGVDTDFRYIFAKKGSVTYYTPGDWGKGLKHIPSVENHLTSPPIDYYQYIKKGDTYSSVLSSDFNIIPLSFSPSTYTKKLVTHTPVSTIFADRKVSRGYNRFKGNITSGVVMVYKGMVQVTSAYSTELKYLIPLSRAIEGNVTSLYPQYYHEGSYTSNFPSIASVYTGTDYSLDNVYEEYSYTGSNSVVIAYVDRLGRVAYSARVDHPSGHSAYGTNLPSAFWNKPVVNSVRLLSVGDPSSSTKHSNPTDYLRKN